MFMNIDKEREKKLEDFAKDIIDIKKYNVDDRCKYVSELVTQYYAIIQVDKDNILRISTILGDIKDILNSNKHQNKIEDEILKVSSKLDNFIFYSTDIKYLVSRIGRAIRFEVKHESLDEVKDTLDNLNHILYSIRTNDTMKYFENK